jgi:hypothetical protein
MPFLPSLGRVHHEHPQRGVLGKRDRMVRRERSAARLRRNLSTAGTLHPGQAVV